MRDCRGVHTGRRNTSSGTRGEYFAGIEQSLGSTRSETKLGEDVGGNGKSKSTTLSKMLSQEQESTAIALSEDAPEIEAGDHNGWRDSLMFR